MFQEVWSSSICQVLKKVSGEEFDSKVLDSKPISGTDELAGVWSLFSASARLTGEIGFFVSESDAKLLSGLVMRGMPNETAVHTDDLRTTVAEFFRRLAGVASPALKAETKAEVEFRFHDTEPPSWEAAFGFRLEVRGTKTPPIKICMISDESLAKSVTSACANRAFSPSATERGKGIPSTVPEKDNIGLLLDIELEATLRFGEREMLLREILNLNSGSVIELNRRVNEPVELLVRGKVVAKGDVVVLDGNYALRVTQIASPADRMSSLRI
jgi:flagellar motor switch protein FliN/FliY